MLLPAEACTQAGRIAVALICRRVPGVWISFSSPASHSLLSICVASRDRADVSIRQGSARKRHDHEEAKVELPELGMRRGNSPFDVRRDPEHFRNGV